MLMVSMIYYFISDKQNHNGPITVGNMKLTIAEINHTIIAIPKAFSQPISYKPLREISHAIPPIIDANQPKLGVNR